MGFDGMGRGELIGRQVASAALRRTEGRGRCNPLYYKFPCDPPHDSHEPCPAPGFLMNVEPSVQKLSFDKRRIKFLFLEGIHANAVNALTDDGYTSVRSLPK